MIEEINLTPAPRHKVVDDHRDSSPTHQLGCRPAETRRYGGTVRGTGPPSPTPMREDKCELFRRRPSSQHAAPG